jgi:hypothetical protein
MITNLAAMLQILEQRLWLGRVFCLLDTDKPYHKEGVLSGLPLSPAEDLRGHPDRQIAECLAHVTGV